MTDPHGNVVSIGVLDPEAVRTVHHRVAGVPPGALVAASVAGVVFGVAYSLSPVTTWFFLLTPLFFWWATRGLKGRERLWVTRLLVAALAVRLVALGGFFLFSDNFRRTLIEAPGDPGAPSPYGVLQGDEWLIKQFSLVAMNVALGERVSPIDIKNLAGDYAQSGFVYAAAYLQILLGPAPYGIHLLNVAAFLVGAAILYRLVRSAYGALPAFVGFVIVLFMPSLFVWSISALKEASYFFLTAVSISAVVRAVRSSRSRGRVAAVVVAVLAITGSQTLRVMGAFMTGGGLILGLAARMATLRAWLCALVVLGVGAGGYYAAGLPSVQARVQGEFSRAAGTHIGHVVSRGHYYKVLDPHFYTWYRYRDDEMRLQPDEAARFVTRAAISFVTAPLPWEAASPSMVALLPQQVFWYVLVGLACVGLGAGFRRDALVTWLLVGVIMCGAAAVALFNGNVGTLVRMRDMIVPLVAWLGALGGCIVLEGIVTRTRRFVQNTGTAACV